MSTDSDIREIVRAFLKADSEYRRDLGAFGPTHRLTISREVFLWHAKQNIRAWYVANFGTADLATPPAESSRQMAGEGA